jgi:hypothetical protein
MRVPVGMLGDDDRRLLIISKSEVAQWSSDYITFALDDDTVFVPWVSAVQVWRPDEAPSLDERMSIIRMYATGSRPASELPPNIRP